MAEQQGINNYITCSTCKKKYINDDESIKSNFGFNILNKQYTCCVKCRSYSKTFNDKPETKEHQNKNMFFFVKKSFHRMPGNYRAQQNT